MCCTLFILFSLYLNEIVKREGKKGRGREEGWREKEREGRTQYNLKMSKKISFK